MYSVIVVDDEEWIREGIMLKLKRSEFPLSCIYGACSGKEALETIMEHKIDLIITDIRMDNIDGLELVSKVKEITDDVEFIIISGYSEFKYAERAINMGVKGYLLKPTTTEDLNVAVTKAIHSIKERRESCRISQENEKNRIRNEKLMLENELNKLLNAKDDCFGYLKKIKHDITQEHNFYQLIVIFINNTSSQSTENSYDELDNLKTGFNELLRDAVHEDSFYIFCNLDTINQLFILVWGGRDKIDGLTGLISKKCFHTIASELNISITIGISSVMGKINEELYKSAKKALDLRLIYGIRKIYKENEINKFNDFVFPRNELKMLNRFIERRELKNVETTLREIFSKGRFEGVNINNLYFVYSEVVNVIYGSLYTINKNFYQVMEYDLSQYGIIKRTSRLDEISEYLYKFIESAIKLNNYSCSNCREVVEKIVQYIDEHYAEKINVKEIASKFSIDANYFSTIFKKELGVTFIRYLTMQRLNMACRMLKETEINIQEIAESIGYPDIQYFYRVFKKEYGVTPLEYKS